MPIAVVESQPPRTYLEAVTEIMKSCGLETPGTLSGADRNTSRAMASVQFALNEVWYKTKWDWRWVWWVMDMTQDIMWYELPADFDKSGARFGVNKSTYSLRFKGYEWLIEQFPYIRNIPAEYGDVTLVQETAAADYAAQTYYWTVKGGYLGLWPPPSDDYIAATSSKLISGYYKELVRPYDDADELGIPVGLWPAHEALSLARLQQYKEWNDFAVTRAEGKQLLAEAVARQRRTYFEEAQLMPEE